MLKLKVNACHVVQLALDMANENHYLINTIRDCRLLLTTPSLQQLARMIPTAEAHI